MKPRILYILDEYLQLSQTYIQTELEALWNDYEIRILALHSPNLPARTHCPFQLLSDPAQIRQQIAAFRPAILHTHVLKNVPLLHALARQTGTPFTVRAHSYDCLGRALSRKPFGFLPWPRTWVHTHIQNAVRGLNDEWCLGVLAFPFTRPLLEGAGVRPDKIFACFPVLDFARFHDRSPNGPGVMNTGACLPKKKMEDFLHLATLVPHRAFNLYPLGYEVERIRRLNEAMGSPVTLQEPVEHHEMPREYKKHTWFVYTADPAIGTVGWPVSFAEAQAAGVGVCAPNLRPDLKEFLGPAGFLYESIEDMARIVSQPLPEELREAGFEQAKKSDITVHKTVLTSLWQEVFAARPL
jgi:hypothetical protein